ncbi:molybdopterin-containing oxidoreductase family protein [Slackia piriformis]|uniref:molybdopterin-containing oxidoreductase family protein n=1 Tax=Slackia piriformis TaxID=626934 RepID=UPI002F92EC3C
MPDSALTRRSFLAAGAAVGAVAAFGGVGVGGLRNEAFAWGEDHVVEYAATTCDGYGNKCGMGTWTQDGALWRFMGLENHPFAHGHLCVRGLGYTASAYSEDRLTMPLKNDGQGNFSAVSWDEAIADIASRIKETDPARVALFQDSRATDQYYAQRFMNALGSANYYTGIVLSDMDILTGITNILGVFPAPHAEGSKYIVLLDKSYYEGVRPAETEEIIRVRENGGNVVAVDPRLPSVGALADEWVCVRPGYELAFLLGVMGHLLNNDLYDKAFVEANGAGFDEFAKSMRAYDAAWASEKTGVPEEKIVEIAEGLAAAAPHCYVDMQWAGTVGSGYRNSAETVRCILLLNAMLDNFNQEGGWVFPLGPWVDDSAFDASVFKPVGYPKNYAIGAGVHPLAYMYANDCQAAMAAAAEGALGVASFFGSNPLADYPQAAMTAEDVANIGFKVVVDGFMTETAKTADYVLPEVSYLERRGIVGTATAPVTVATLRNPAIEQVHPETKPTYQIIVDLAEACGLGEYFTFTLDQLNETYCAAYGVSYDALKSDGLAPIPGCELEFGSVPMFATKSGKIEFSCEAYAVGEMKAVPTWIEPAATPADGSLRLITGDQVFQNKTYTRASDKLTQIAKDFEADRVWIASSRAAELGIADGDTVELSNENGAVQVEVRVTGRIHHDAAYLPPHYGCASEEIRTAFGFGASHKALVTRQAEPESGAGMLQEVLVNVKKVGA